MTLRGPPPSPDDVLAALRHTPPEDTDRDTIVHVYTLKNAIVAQHNYMSQVHQNGLLCGIGLGMVAAGLVAAMMSARTGLK